MFFTLERTQRPQIQRTINPKAVSSLFIFNLLQWSYTNKCQERGCTETDCARKKATSPYHTGKYVTTFFENLKACNDFKVESFASTNIANAQDKN